MLETRLRTHTCGEITIDRKGQNVVLTGWVHRVRDHGGILFLDLRDRWGRTQVTVDSAVHPALYAAAQKIRREDVVRVSGAVVERPEDMKNRDLPTGEIEVAAGEVTVLNPSEVPPFEISEKVPPEDLALEFRYMYLRRPEVLHRLTVRHATVRAIRQSLEAESFMEVETPMFVRSTPEGSRDFVVPSRVYPGTFFALPQSPQLYKQILMVAGMDRYFQFARCFRDEDPRGGRQVVHTQIDLEMSFVGEEDIYRVVEAMLAGVCREVLGRTVETPFQRMTYAEAIDRFGIDKPDLRFGMELRDLTDLLAASPFDLFRDAASRGQAIRAFAVPKGAALPRREIDGFAEFVRTYGAKGVLYAKVLDQGLDTGFAKHVPADVVTPLCSRLGAAPGDLILLVVDSWKVASRALGQLRNLVARKLDMIPEGVFRFLWVTEFPLYEWDEEAKKWQAMHHIFTMPAEEDIERIESDPGSVRGRLYDIVLNGVELGSGSIRLHLPDLQRRVMRVIGMTEEDAERKFGFLIRAFRFGAPPHGGIALGVDNLVMTLLGLTNIREVIAFPNASSGRFLLDGAPSPIEPEQLAELGIRVPPAP